MNVSSKLDKKALLGFRMLDNEKTKLDATVGVKKVAKAGAKSGAKVGAKVGVKIGNEYLSSVLMGGKLAGKTN